MRLKGKRVQIPYSPAAVSHVPERSGADSDSHWPLRAGKVQSVVTSQKTCQGRLLQMMLLRGWEFA